MHVNYITYRHILLYIFNVHKGKEPSSQDNITLLFLVQRNILPFLFLLFVPSEKREAIYGVSKMNKQR